MNKTKKKKVPLFPLKSYKTVNNIKGHPMLSDSSDDSDILDNLSDCEANEDNTIYSKINNKINNKDFKLQLNLLNLNVSKSDINPYMTPRPTIDAFRDIEEYVAESSLDKNKINNNSEIKNQKDEGKTPEINKKENFKIINDFYINNDGDIELTDNTQKDGKNKQKNEGNNVITKFLGPLLEEDEYSTTIFINQNKSIFSSIKELWEYQKILLENQIFDMKSKK